MKMHLKKMRNSAKGSRRLTLAGIVIAIAVFAIGAATVVSRQRTKVLAAQHAQSVAANVLPNNAANNVANKDKDGRKYITVKVAGQDVQLDTQTGDMKPLTPEEAEKLAAGLKRE